MKFITTQFYALSFGMLIVMLLENSINAAPGPLLRVTELYQQSDIVAVGRVQETSAQEPTSIDWHGSRLPGRVIRVELLVNKLIKGSSQPGSLFFDFFQPNAGVGFRTVSKGQYGMFFLKRSTSNVISVTSPYYPFIIALADIIQTAEVGLSRVAQELALVLNSPKTKLEEKISAINAIETINVPSVNLHLKDAFRKSNEQLKLYLASALLKRGDPSPLEYAVNAILAPPQPANRDQLFQLALSIESGIHDPDSLPLLVKLLRTKEARFRRPIAEAIRSIKIEAAIEPLSTLLYDSNIDVRYVAVIGLAEITGQYKWGPAEDVFQNDERQYLDYWKAWSRLRQK